MKPRQLLVTLATGAALANPKLAPARAPLSVHNAIEIAQNEIQRQGLEETYHVAALYAGLDRHAEGAAFAAMVWPRERGRSTRQRLKLLIHEDGHTTLQIYVARRAAA